MQSESANSSMTQQLSQQLMDLIDSNLDNAKVLHATLNTIVQYTPDDESKLYFKTPRLYENIKLIINFPTYAPLSKICLTLLVHFSGCPDLQKLIIDKNIEDIIMKVRSGLLEGLNEELSLLLLLNVSKNCYFAEYMLGVTVEDNPNYEQQVNEPTEHPMVGQQMMIANTQEPITQKIEQKQKIKKEPITYNKSVLLTVIYSFFQSKPNRAWIIANIFVNLSSFQHGRRYVAQEKIYVGLLAYINHEKEALRLAVLRILRNVSFLWEEDHIAQDLMDGQNRVIDNIVVHMLLMLWVGSTYAGTEPTKLQQLIKKHYEVILGDEQKLKKKLKELESSFEGKNSEKLQKSVMNEIQICVDILVILSNTNWPEKKPIFSLEGLKQTISVLKFVKSEEFGEGARNKLEAIETFCLW